ncbi:DNA polymerase beta superfamily protein [Lentzea sp. NPDC092896]|uniref:DNA polymerase beta superfamily protein n=1 Tax=Lentzea sp. NPDC092896 TaxID=3364127 RepID=UPI0037F67089
MSHSNTEFAAIAKHGTILQTEVGSGVHGLSIDGAGDRDEMGICLEPPEFVIGLRTFEQYEYRTAAERTGIKDARSEPGDLDLVVYSLRKWMRLALQGNPTVITPLFAPDEAIVHITPAGKELRANADMIVSRQAGHRFIGYLRGQRERMLNGNVAARVNRPELVEQYGFDCYLDDTEFLTRRGWLRYDEIADDEAVGTVNQVSGAIEFQVPSERVAKPYSGPIHFFRHRYSSCAVTPNHRMWTSPVNRGPSGRIGNVYRPEIADWGFRRADELGKNHHVRVVGTPREDEYPMPDSMLALVGAFVSEGSVAKRRKDGTASVMVFTQKTGNRLEPVLAAIGQDHAIRQFTYTREPDAFRSTSCEYSVYTLANRKLANQIDTECGSGALNKRLPSWALDLSARQAEVLLHALLAGDGTRCRGGWQVYYTISPGLAGDVQALAVIAGRRSNMWGPYNTGMYQVMIQEPGREFETLKLSANRRVEDVTDRRIVCFTVPNETLVTRREGRVAMHGNTKFAGHMVRLGVQGVELLETGRMTLPMPEPWRTWIRDLRQGKHTEQDAIDAAADLEARLIDLTDNADLPKQPDTARADRWLIETYQAKWVS